MCETRPLSHFHLTYFKVGVQRCCSADLGCNQCLFELLLPTILPAFDLCPLALTRHTPPHSAAAANWIFSLFQTILNPRGGCRWRENPSRSANAVCHVQSHFNPLFFPHSDARYELQQDVVIMYSCPNLLRSSRVIG